MKFARLADQQLFNEKDGGMQDEVMKRKVSYLHDQVS